MITNERLFANQQSLAEALAAEVAEALDECVRLQGQACLAVSGGTTPLQFFASLSKINVPWQQITVTLVDERQVPLSSERSNTRLVHQNLLQNHAASASFKAIAEDIEIDVAVLGMGQDGHTASLFPGGDNLVAALDPAGTRKVMTMNAPGADEPRLTFTLAALLAARHIFLHIEGQSKRDVLEIARGDGPVEEMPIRAFLRAAKSLNLFWCP